MIHPVEIRIARLGLLQRYLASVKFAIRRAFRKNACKVDGEWLTICGFEDFTLHVACRVSQVDFSI